MLPTALNPDFRLKRYGKNLKQEHFIQEKYEKICIIGKKAVPLHSLLKSNDIGAIAQLVEQRTENPCVPGSIPGGTTLKKSNSQQTPDFQTKSGVFVFSPYAKNGNILPFAVFQISPPWKSAFRWFTTFCIVSKRIRIPIFVELMFNLKVGENETRFI